MNGVLDVMCANPTRESGLVVKSCYFAYILKFTFHLRFLSLITGMTNCNLSANLPNVTKHFLKPQFEKHFFVLVRLNRGCITLTVDCFQWVSLVQVPYAVCSSFCRDDDLTGIVLFLLTSGNSYLFCCLFD